jgi:hypothetical protein
MLPGNYMLIGQTKPEEEAMDGAPVRLFHQQDLQKRQQKKYHDDRDQHRQGAPHALAALFHVVIHCLLHHVNDLFASLPPHWPEQRSG